MADPLNGAALQEQINQRVRLSQPFLSLRNSLRGQLLRSQGFQASPAATTQRGGDTEHTSTMLNGSLLAHLRNASAPSQSGKSMDSDHVVKEFVASALRRPSQQQQHQQTSPTPKHGGGGAASHEVRVGQGHQIPRDNVVWLTKQLQGPLLQRHVGGNPPQDDAPLQLIIAGAQREWRNLINVRLASLKLLAQYPSAARQQQAQEAALASSAMGLSDGDSASAAGSPVKAHVSSSSNSTAIQPIATVEDLVTLLVERFNSRVTTTGGTGDVSSSAVPADVIANVGLLSSFTAAVHQFLDDKKLIPSVTELREVLHELDPTQRPKGLDHSCLSGTSCAVAEQQFAVLLEESDRPECLLGIAARGIAPSLRRLIYARILGLPLNVAHSTNAHLAETRRIRFASATAPNFVRLGQQLSTQYSLLRPNPPVTGEAPPMHLLRCMAAADTAGRAGDSDRYFVFADEILAVSLAMLEDGSIPDRHMHRAVGGGSGVDAYLVSVANPNGPRLPLGAIIPLAGWTSCIAPLCFVTGDASELYDLAVAMHGQIWSRLHSCTTDALGMFVLFERLCAHYAPSATYFCFSRLGVSPLVVAARWMVNGFADLLDPLEILQLWDAMLALYGKRLFGFGTMQPWWVLAAAAAALFSLRGSLIVQCTTVPQLLKLFEDGVKLKVFALVQQMLFLN